MQVVRSHLPLANRVSQVRGTSLASLQTPLWFEEYKREVKEVIEIASTATDKACK